MKQDFASFSLGIPGPICPGGAPGQPPAAFAWRGRLDTIRSTRRNCEQPESLLRPFAYLKICESCPSPRKPNSSADQAEHPPFGTNLTEPIGNYTRYCQTSSTTGSPSALARHERKLAMGSWTAGKRCFAGLVSARATASSFRSHSGLFLGFWSAFEAGAQIGAQCIPGGGMSSAVRLELIRKLKATVVCCTPTYALWLAEIAAKDETAPRPAFRN